MASELEHHVRPGDYLQFHHVQLYSHSLHSLEHYQKLQDLSNSLAKRQLEKGQVFLSADMKAELRDMWNSLAGSFKNDGPFQPTNRDVVEQLIIALGWRVIGYKATADLTAVIVTSNSPAAAKFIVTAPRAGATKSGAVEAKAEGSMEITSAEASSQAPPAESISNCWTFSAAAQQQFFDSHKGRQGVGIMCFEVLGEELGVAEIFKNYQTKHPNLLATAGPTIHVKDGDNVLKTLEVFAFYKPGQSVEPDKGTVLQFVEKRGPKCSKLTMPFFDEIPVEFGTISLPVFPDHWVSNVVDREQYLTTLSDVLGFQPKVNFNAGVVAAGEAIIESTVTGNSPRARIKDAQGLLENQQQIYLPINNSLSEFGHVHFFIEEVGQGIQHIASRCSDLVSFIQRANDMREITNHGFTFLRIPRSYYGYLKTSDLIKATCKCEEDCQKLFNVLASKAVIDTRGIVDLDIDPIKVEAACAATGFDAATVLPIVQKAQFNHLIDLLGDRLPQSELLSIVRNQILIDIQGNDILYQIFTSCILQEKANDEAPFLEFIQRVCDTSGGQKPIKPGCGGFGIRNFLTLFLSIEVTKAITLTDTGRAEGDALKVGAGKNMVQALTEQLNVSNPILTAISDAMTREDELLAEIKTLESSADQDESKLQSLREQVEVQRGLKEDGNTHLMKVSEMYKKKLQKLRADYEASVEAAVHRGT